MAERLQRDSDGECNLDLLARRFATHLSALAPLVVASAPALALALVVALAVVVAGR